MATTYKLQFRKKGEAAWTDSRITASSMTEVWTDVYERLGGTISDAFEARVVPVEEEKA